MSLLKASIFIPELAKHLGQGYVYGSVGQICTIALLKTKERQYGQAMGNGYYQLNGDYTKGLCAKWLGKWVADCSGLIKAVRRDLTGVYRDVSAQGTYDQCWKTGPISTMPMTPGCCVFKWYASAHRMGHVGMYVGNGKVIESANVRVGVIKSTFKGWSHWGLLDWMAFDLPIDQGAPSYTEGELDYPGDHTGPKPGDNPYPPNLPLQVGLGSTGSAVTQLQQVLNAKGADPKLVVDGVFGPLTLAAVKAYQKANALPVDGIVGRLTWSKLLEPDTQPPSSQPELRYGSKGDAVKNLQEELNAHGANPQLAMDGDFGQLTLHAVYDFQKEKGLAVDGVVGPKTWAALLG